MKQQYLVAVVGAPESGKTVYLATLGHLLGEERVAPGVTTRIVPAQTEALLQKTYNDIADPAATFPPPTPLGGTLQWDIECGVSARGRNFPLMTISYFDAAGGRYPLGAVRAALLGDSKGRLRGLIEDRKPGSGRWPHSPGRVRLVPVTSLGGSFAFVDAEGVVQKRPGAEPDPMNVLVPFTAVLPDLCIRAAEAVEADRRAAAAVRRRESRQSAHDFGTLTVLGLSIPIAGMAMAVASGLAVTSRGIGGLVMKGRLPIGVALAMLREPALKRVRTDRAAFRYMMKHLVRHLRDFERSFPDSRLV